MVWQSDNRYCYQWVNAAVLKLGVATLLRVAKYFLRVAKVYTTGFCQVILP